MISATDALALPTARLTDEEKTAADRLDAAIDLHLRREMGRHGAAYEALETRAPVIGEVTCRLRAQGWQVQVLPLMGQTVLSRKPEHIGYKLVLVPSDTAYAAANNEPRN